MTEDATNQPDPAQAFEAVRRELSLLHSAVAGLAAEREKIPDYSETLGRIAHALGEHNKRLAAIEQSRAISLSPAELVKEIAAAAETVRIEDRRMLDTARGALDQALGRVDGMIRDGFSHSLMSFSQIAFSRDGKDALVSFGVTCGSLCGSGATIHLRKQTVGWVIVDRCSNWIS